MRVDVGSGYRLYFTRKGKLVIVLLASGDESSLPEARHRPGATAGEATGPEIMTKRATRVPAKAPTKLLPFDAARYLTDDESVAEYLSAVLDTGNADLLLMALGDVARARGMTQVARDAGLGRESLYKALSPGAKPRLDTVLEVARALGVRFSARVA